MEERKIIRLRTSQVKRRYGNKVYVYTNPVLSPYIYVPKRLARKYSYFIMRKIMHDDKLILVIHPPNVDVEVNVREKGKA